MRSLLILPITIVTFLPGILIWAPFSLFYDNEDVTVLSRIVMALSAGFWCATAIVFMGQVEIMYGVISTLCMLTTLSSIKHHQC